MEPSERQRFGAFLRQLREKQNLSLREVETAVKEVRLSNSYLYQIERGDRNPPRVEIMRELARVYQVPLGTLLAAAGYEEAPRIDLYQNQINRAFEYVRSDSSFRYGMQAQGDTLSLETKRFIVELYERANPGIKLLSETLAAPQVSDDDEEEVAEDE
jgi:transcriptional regulator with XRE-family HTH domain